MTDSLRDRVAAVIAGIACCDTHRREPERFDLDAADAVIGELGIRQECLGPVTVYRAGRYHPDWKIVRVVSDWKSTP